MSADADLIARCRAFCTTLAAHVELVRRNGGEQQPAWTGRRSGALVAAIVATPAASRAGIRAKIEVLKAHQAAFVPPCDMAAVDRRIAASIFADLLKED